MTGIKLLQSILLIAAFGISAVLSDLFQSAAALPKSTDYDFVIVGGGVAGSVLANRLTENPKINVLLIEAGIPNTDVELQIPLFCTRLNPFTKWDWNYTTEAMPGLGGRNVTYARGFTLGGSSSINFMMYTRGSREDYDRFAEVTGDKGWGWNSMINYFKKGEALKPPVDHHKTAGQFNPSDHGNKGPLSVAKEQPHQFPFNLDINSGNPIGIGWCPFTILNGKRASSATAYLAPPFTSRKNLHVVLQTRVLKLDASKTSNGLQFRTVRFADSRNGPVFSVTAKKEVILSAGSLNTPQILMNSGVGDPTQLSQHKITTLVPLSSVGKNVTDHPASTLRFSVNSTNTLEQLSDPDFMALQQQLWNTNGTGFLGGTFSNQVGFLRLPNSVLKGHPDPAPGPNTAHFELLFTNGFLGPPPASGNYFSISVALLTPTSRGSVQLRSNNPWDAPRVTPNFLGNDFDRQMFREAMKIAQKFVAAKSFKNWIIAPVENPQTDEEIDEYLRQTIASFFHPVGTAAMSPASAQWGVVNPDLKVKHAGGLRVVDASVFPFIPTAHTQAATYGLAERAADIIKHEWHL